MPYSDHKNECVNVFVTLSLHRHATSFRRLTSNNANDEASSHTFLCDRWRRPLLNINSNLNTKLAFLNWNKTLAHKCDSNLETDLVYSILRTSANPNAYEQRISKCLSWHINPRQIFGSMKNMTKTDCQSKYSGFRTNKNNWGKHEKNNTRNNTLLFYLRKCQCKFLRAYWRSMHKKLWLRRRVDLRIVNTSTTESNSSMLSTITSLADTGKTTASES